MYNRRKGLWENNCQKWDLDWNVSRRGGRWSARRRLLYLFSQRHRTQLSPEGWDRAHFRVPIWTRRNKLGSRRRTDYEMRSSDDITSLVPCLAVKGTNLMISRGLDRWSSKNGKWVKCLFFTVAFHHYNSKVWWPGPSSPTEGNEPWQMSHISRLQEEPMVGHVYNY